MRTTIAALLLLMGFSFSAFAQSSSGGGGSSSSSGPSTGPRAPSAAPRAASPTAPQAPTSGASTPSQRNLDIAPPTRNLPESQGNAVTPQPPEKGAGPASVSPQDNQVPPPSGRNSRFEPSGANSSVKSGQNRTGKNALSESYTTCINIWDAGTHMSKSEWARACKRVENRLDTLQREAVDASKRLPQSRLSERK